MMIPPVPAGTFRVGMRLEGPVKYAAEFGLFIAFDYKEWGRTWSIDGLLSFYRTPHPEAARAYKYDDRVAVIATDWNPRSQRLQVSLPVDPSWLTTDVVLLARGIASESAFDRLPILADALQEAGCPDEPLLHRLRHAPANEVSWLLPLLVGRTFADSEGCFW